MLSHGIIEDNICEMVDNAPNLPNIVRHAFVK
jgi:hypothetical protein